MFDITETVFTQDNALMQAASGKDGNFTFSDIPFGNYIIREISAAEGYLLCEEGIPVSIDQDGKEIEITVINKRAEGNVRLVKISSYDTKLHLSGAEFEIYKDVDGNGAYTEGTDTFVCNLTETDKGIYTANNLPCGKYV